MTWNIADDRQPKASRSLILHPRNLSNFADRRDVNACLEEAVSLAKAINLLIVHSEVINLEKPRPSSLIGKGGVKRLGSIIAMNNVEVAVIDTNLTAIQQRNLEQAWKCKVLDRTGLIIQIFGARARSKEGVLQVELAALNYQRSRLVRTWTHLERQRGGGGFMGGPGETQIEADRRFIGKRITKLRKELKEVSRTRTLHRKARQKVPYPVVALVGYTNAGKSTLFNALTASDVVARDQLFATLDPTMRGLKLPSGQKTILLDTVGFISKLPHELVDAFQATLEEVTEADVILHVHDISHPDADAQKSDVLDVLRKLGLTDTSKVPLIEVRNKVDCLNIQAKVYQSNHAERSNNTIILVSAKTGEGFEALIALLDDVLSTHRTVLEIRLPWEEGRTLAWLYERGQVVRRHDRDECVEVTVKLNPKDAARLEFLIPNHSYVLPLESKSYEWN